jgi:hypothetical protein
VNARRRLAAAALLAVVPLVLSGCGGGPPDIETWTARWEEAKAFVPDLSAFADGPDERLCDEVLVELREVREDLVPAPDELLGITVDEWLRHAETIFFECPPETGPVVGFDAAYAELDRLEREVESLLP